MKINTGDSDIKLARLYWGPGPLPARGTLIGLVTRPDGQSGAAIRMSSGLLMQGSAGVLRSTGVRLQSVKFTGMPQGEQIFNAVL